MLRLIVVLILCAAAWPCVAQVDPTKNVLDLVQAAIQRQDDLRTMEAKFQNTMREKDALLSAALRDAEARRRDDLAAQKQTFDTALAGILQKNSEEKSALLATAVKEVRADFDSRMSKQEQFRFEAGARGAGQSDLIGWIVAFVMGSVALASLALNFRRLRAPA